MAATLDLSRWRSAPRGVNYRRGIIIATGLRQLFRLRFYKLLLAAAWGAGVLIAVLGFGFSQAVAEGGWLETLARSLGPRAEAHFAVLGALLLLYPDVCIGGFYTLVFWVHSFVGLWLSLVALAVLVPRLIARDRASNALIAYFSRPLTSADYLLGKLGIIAGLLAGVWTGPLLLGWALSVALAPNADFVLYSLDPLGRALLFQGIALVALAAIALGVSALSRSSRHTLVIWIGLWLILGFIALERGDDAPLWLQRASFTRNLDQVRTGILQPDAALLAAAQDLPLSNRDLADSLQRAGEQVQRSDFEGALAGLAVFAVLFSAVFLRRLRPS